MLLRLSYLRWACHNVTKSIPPVATRPSIALATRAAFHPPHSLAMSAVRAPRLSRDQSTSSITHAVTDQIAADVHAEAELTGPTSIKVTTTKGRGRGATKAKVDATEASGDQDGEEEAAPAKRRVSGTKRKAAAAQTTPDENEDPSAAKKGKAKQSQDDDNVVQDEPELDSDGEPVRRAKNGRKLPKKKAKAPKVYVIPEVAEKRDFRQEYRPGSTDDFSSKEARKNGFTGRLGYACLNTVLRTADPPIFSSRTARLKSIQENGLDWVKDLARQNARDMIPMLEWNAANNIRFMRLSSEIFPFASHKEYGYSVDCAKDELAAAGALARKLGIRLTSHPGQFTVIGSPSPSIVEASIRELKMHADTFDLMGMDQDSVMILHGGGVYGDRPATLERMRETIKNKLPENVRNRLVLENDEISWSAEELLPICREFTIPMVFDFHHDMLRPSAKSPRELMPELLDLFRQRNIRPKVSRLDQIATVNVYN